MNPSERGSFALVVPSLKEVRSLLSAFLFLFLSPISFSPYVYVCMYVRE